MFKNDQIQVVFLGLNRKIILIWLKITRSKYYPMYFYNFFGDWKMKLYNYIIFLKFEERVKTWFIIMIILNF